ncbi:MAG: sensor histidine kinase [Ruminococcaceae bacterium]|nr:sensor histidine kinase [Oscillospiraceae bacterium]
MDELSLYVLDITMNSVRAGADEIEITLREDGEWLDFSVQDNGCGMTEEQVKKLGNPFFTTRKTRKVGLGIPFLTMLAEMTGGYVKIHSVHESVSEDHGTKTEARFGKNHIDFIPLGDMIETVKTLIQGSPEVNFTYTHETEQGKVELSCAALREILGEDISLAEPDILGWIGAYLSEQYEEMEKASE